MGWLCEPDYAEVRGGPDINNSVTKYAGCTAGATSVMTHAMRSTVFANGLAIVHQNSGGESAVFPDVCLTPAPGGMAPIPYTNTGYYYDTAKGPTTVKLDGCMPNAKGAVYRQSYGDEPGTGGGVVSGVNRDVAEFIQYSFDVKLEGRNACRLGDRLQHNKKNTVG